MKNKWTIGLAVVSAMLCCSILCGFQKKQSNKASVPAKNVASLQPEQRPPLLTREYRYPNIPDKLHIGFDKEPRKILREANNREEIVAWVKDYALVQNLDHHIFLVYENAASGIIRLFIFLYVYDGSHWQLIYMGNAGLPQLEEYIKCAYFDYDKKAICFEKKDGALLSMLKIGHEMDLLKKKH